MVTAYSWDNARSFILPRQALNDAENLMIAIERHPEILIKLGWDPDGDAQRIAHARQAISEAIAASDAEHPL